MRWLSCYWCWWSCWNLNGIGWVGGDNGGAAELFTRPPPHCVTTCILKLKIGQKFSCMTINFNLQAHGTRPTQESFFFSRPTLFFWVWVCKELLRLVEPSGHWSRREPSQLLSRDLLQWLCRSSSDVKTNTNTQKCKVLFSDFISLCCSSHNSLRRIQSPTHPTFCSEAHQLIPIAC